MELSRRTIGLVAWPLAILAIGCSDGSKPTGVVDPPLPALRDVVVGDAAAALQSDGTFARNDSVQYGPLPLISGAHAAEIAVEFVYEFGGVLSPLWSNGRGAGIDPLALVACGAVQFVDSPYEPIPVAVSFTSRKQWGPRYFVQFCGADARVQVVISVAALATDLTITAHVLAPTADLGITIITSGVPVAWNVPFTAEDAARVAAQLTGAKISTVPRMMGKTDAHRYLFGVWSIELDRAIALRDVGSSSVTASRMVLLTDDGYYRATLARADSLSLWPATILAEDDTSATRMVTVTTRQSARPATVFVYAIP